MKSSADSLELEEIEEAYLLMQDAAESAALDTRAMIQPTADQRWKIFSFVTLGYLLLDLLSTYVPGPGQWVGLDQHVQLFHRLGSLF